MADIFLKFTGEIDRRSPANEGEVSNPIVRENFLARDGVLRKPRGTEEAVATILDDKPRWISQYYTNETGVTTPKTFAYTKDGKLWSLDLVLETATVIKENLNPNAYPNSWMFKSGEQVFLYLVDGKNLWKYDGNNDLLFVTVTLEDNEGKSVLPIDIREHRDRSLIISQSFLFVSKNLNFDVFDDPTDSIQIIIGSGKGKNLAINKIEDRFYILNTEGIFVLTGDVISALASTFDIDLIEERNIIAGRTAIKVEKAIVFWADDYELWSFNGNSSEMLTFNLKLKDFCSRVRQNLDKATATYFNNYYMMSFVEDGETEPNLEVWWDALKPRTDIVRGRNVSCFAKSDPTREDEFLLLGRSDVNKVMYADRGFNFGGLGIAVRFITRSIFVKKGHNVRFLAFYPEIEQTGNTNITIQYLLDTRNSNLDVDSVNWTQNLRGDTITLGEIKIPNQTNFTDRIRPKIKFSRGESIAFRIEDTTIGAKLNMVGMGIDFATKSKSKGATIGA